MNLGLAIFLSSIIIGVIPAMEAGLTNKLWSIGDLVKLI